MKTIALAAAIVAATVAVSAAATPAFAKAQGRFGDAKVTYNAAQDRYCFREPRAGSVVPVTTCRSKADWALEGLTIRHKPVVQVAQR